MRSRSFIVSLFSAILVLLALSLPACAHDGCDDLPDGKARIAACTESIQSGKYKGKELAKVYNNRGNVYGRTGAYDLAIADYTKAISIDPKNATAYYNRGNVYDERGDYILAIRDYTTAISIDQKYGSAYNNRGNAYSKKGEYHLAIADYTRAISIDPKDADAYNNRGEAYKDEGNYDLAIADYTMAISIDPKLEVAYFARGRLLYSLAAPDKALGDFSRANALDPKYAYSALWLEMAVRRLKLPSRMAEASAQVDKTAWPAPVIRMFMDQITPEAVLAAADHPDETKRKVQVCEANFYAGEYMLLRGGRDEGMRLLRLAAGDCPKTFVERAGAEAELKANAAGR